MSSHLLSDLKPWWELEQGPRGPTNPQAKPWPNSGPCRAPLPSFLSWHVPDRLHSPTLVWIIDTCSSQKKQQTWTKSALSDWDVLSLSPIMNNCSLRLLSYVAVQRRDGQCQDSNNPHAVEVTICLQHIPGRLQAILVAFHLAGKRWKSTVVNAANQQKSKNKQIVSAGFSTVQSYTDASTTCYFETHNFIPFSSL